MHEFNGIGWFIIGRNQRAGWVELMVLTALQSQDWYFTTKSSPSPCFSLHWDKSSTNLELLNNSHLLSQVLKLRRSGLMLLNPMLSTWRCPRRNITCGELWERTHTQVLPIATAWHSRTGIGFSLPPLTSPLSNTQHTCLAHSWFSSLQLFLLSLSAAVNGVYTPWGSIRILSPSLGHWFKI